LKIARIIIFVLLLAGLFRLPGCDKNNSTGNDDPYELWQQMPNQRLVFMSRADSPEGELYLLDKTDSITRLTNNNRYENNPALSSDGAWVAFHAGNESNPLTWEIYILNLQTGVEIQLTDNNVIDGHPDWSPDGSRIVFASFRDSLGNPSGTADIFVVNTDGTGLIRLTDSPYEDNDPEWSPDGTLIAFKSTRRTELPAREEIYVMNSDGTNVRRLTTTTGWQSDHDPSWAPGSDRIVYDHYEGSRPWTDIANLDTLINRFDELTPWNEFKVDLEGNASRLTNTDEIAGICVYSSDGNYILYLDYEFIFNNGTPTGVNHRLKLANPSGESIGQLTPDDRHTPTMEYFDW